ncbi:hypothetical protein ACWEV4_31055 [Streptomyces sp. NPDC003860]
MPRRSDRQRPTLREYVQGSWLRSSAAGKGDRRITAAIAAIAAIEARELRSLVTAEAVIRDRHTSGLPGSPNADLD